MSSEDINVAIEFNPYNQQAYENRGVYYQSIEDIDKAIDDWEKAGETESQFIQSVKEDRYSH